MSDPQPETRPRREPGIPPRRRNRRPRPLDVAIVGMGCKFPGSEDLFGFWKNILLGRDCTSDVPADRWDADVFFDPASTANDRVYCKRGGYLSEPIGFDPIRHGVMPLAVEGGEPEQFLILDAARAALDDAGLTAGVPKNCRAEVVIGRGNYFNRGNLTRLQHGRIVAQTLAILESLHPEWTEEDLEDVREDLKSSLPPFEAGTVPGQLTNATAGRIADRLDLNGSSYVVDAASASSLVALDLGTRALVERKADIALVGGVYLASDVDFPLVFTRLGALSRSGKSRPFATSADGTLPGEGVGVVVLKRLADAERDGDRIYAVVQGVGVASDGKGAGLAAPSAKGHYRAIRRAYTNSGIDPATVDLVEGHGLGVPAADLAELRALNAVFPNPPRGKRALGAVSALIGHAMPAAGMAGLIKSALSLHHRILPPNPNADESHALLGGDHPFTLNGECRPWLHGETAYPRRAGVNAFGFAGINAHAVLEEHSGSADSDTPGCMTDWDSEAILLGAADRAQWLEIARALLGWLDTGVNTSVPLKDLAYTLNTGQGLFRFRVAMVSATTADFRKRLENAIGRIADPKCKSIRDASGTYFWEDSLGGPGRLAFLYPGEGSQYPGMLADLCPHFPELRGSLDTADRVALQAGNDLLPSDQLFNKIAGQGLWQIETAVNVVLASQWALHQLLTKLGLEPDAVVGHSSGEFLALAAAGVVPMDHELEVRLGELGSVFAGLEKSGKVPVATLLAVASDRAKVEAICRTSGKNVSIAIDNCAHQVVIAGDAADMAELAAILKEERILSEELPFHRAYHTSRFAAALEPIREFFERLPLSVPKIPLYSCATASVMTGGIEGVRSLAVEQWVSTVEFRSTVEAMHADGVRLFVDVGARGNLAGFVEDSLRGKAHFAVAANLPRRSGILQLNHLVASLYAHGVALRPDHLYARRRPKTIDLAVDWQPPKREPALAVGFPEMRLSEELAERLRIRAVAAANVLVGSNGHEVHEAASYYDSSHSENGNGYFNGRADDSSHSSPTAGYSMPSHPPASNGTTISNRVYPTPSTNGHGHDHAPSPTRPAPAPSPSIAQPEALLAYFETMDEFLETQRQVMEAYLNRRPESDGHVHHQISDHGLVNSHATPPMPAAPVARLAAPEPPGPVVAPEPEPLVVAEPVVETHSLDIQSLLLDQVSRRTGYPVEMLGLDLDMEADLGIDSIKRVEIFGELQSAGVVPDGTHIDTLSRCRTLGQIVEVLGKSNAAASKPDLSWLGEVKTYTEGREIVALRKLDVETDPVAAHHTLGGRHVSDLDTDRLGYPVVAFTVMAELLAQAAGALLPNKAVIALRGVQANRWMAYENEPIVLELRAVCDPMKPDEVNCSIRNLGSSGKRRAGNDDPDVQGVVVFASERPARPAAAPYAVKEAGKCRFTADELYRDQWLFHGEALQALTHVGAASKYGIHGTLEVLPLRALLPRGSFPKLHTDPIVLDAFTHLLGGWGLDKQAGEEGDVMFPLRLGELTVFGAEPAAGTEFDCRITIREITRHRVHAEAEIVDSDGKVWMRIRDWYDWRFYWPGRFRDVFRQPKTIFVGEPIELPGSNALAVWLEPPVDMAKPVWRDVLEWCQLSPSEREANRVIGEAEPALSLRIWGRVAAKEIARRFWLSQGFPPVYPADVAIEDGHDGRLTLSALVDQVGTDHPTVVLADAEGLVFAAGALDPTTKLGIAVARLEGQEPTQLSAGERTWLESNTTPGREREEWTARFTAAKQSVANAAGLSSEVVDADLETGVLALGTQAGANASGILVRTGRKGETVWALTTLEGIGA